MLEMRCGDISGYDRSAVVKCLQKLRCRYLFGRVRGKYMQLMRVGHLPI